MLIKILFSIIGVILFCACGKKEYSLELDPQGTFVFDMDTTSVLSENYPRYYDIDSTLIWVDRSERTLTLYKPNKNGYGFYLRNRIVLPDTPVGLISDIFYLNKDSLFVYYHSTQHEEKLSLFNADGKFIRKIAYSPYTEKFKGMMFRNIRVPAVSLQTGFHHNISVKDSKIYAYFHNYFRFIPQKQSIYGAIDINGGDTIDWFPIYYPEEYLKTDNPLQMHRCNYYHILSRMFGDSLFISYSHTARIDVYDRKTKAKIATKYPKSRLANFPNDTIDMNAHPKLEGNSATAISGLYNYIYHDPYRNVFYRQIFGPRSYDSTRKEAIGPDAAVILQILDRDLEVIGETKMGSGKLFISPLGVHVISGEETKKANAGNYGRQKYVYSTYKLVTK